MNTSSDQDEYKDEEMTPDSKPLKPYPPNTDQVIYSNDEMDTTKKLLKNYYNANIDHNHSNCHMIWKIVKEERRALRVSIDLFKKFKLPYSSTNYLLIAKVKGSKIRQRNDKDKFEQSTPQVNNAEFTKKSQHSTRKII